ncbi:MAG: guanylate kinase [bacterium]|nr:guanylate kinase [bacterium]
MENTRTQLLAAIRDYKMPFAAAAFLNQNPPLIISAVTASGKNTVANYILKNQPNYRETVSHTTRPPRPGEVNGIHYWFVDEAKMLGLVRTEAFVEVKAVHGETVYGTSLQAYKTVLESGHTPLLVIDVQGAEELRRGLEKIRPFFILPPSYEEWMNRLHSRGVIDDDDKTIRLASAKRELKTALANPAYILIVNDKVEQTAEIILAAEVDTSVQDKNRQLAEAILSKLGS